MSKRKKVSVSGLRIQYKNGKNGYVELQDILKEINEPESFSWSILLLEVHRYYGSEPSIVDLENQASDQPQGLEISWNWLNTLAEDVTQFENLILVGCSSRSEIKRWENPLDQYENSYIYIEMFDFGYWEVFSKDHAFIKRLENKFKNTETLSPDFREIDKG